MDREHLPAAAISNLMTTDATGRLGAALAGRYRIERQLGQGGMATVYLANDLKHDRKVALKVLKPELAAVLGAERFVVEIKTTASLQHPHILPLFDSGTADGFLYYVMPYIEGETLRDKLRRETQVGVDESVRITTHVADALDYAHRHGVIHRDIKPENILLHDGRPIVADFGIALAVSAAAGGRMTETGLSLGTPHYMSPEQATADKDITARSDIYSLASVLYEMLAGQPPHMGGSAQQIIMKIIAEPVGAVTQHRKSVPPNVSDAIRKALEKLPADRFESAKTFAEALGNPAYRSGGIARVPSQTGSGQPRFRDPVFLTVAAAGIVGLVVAAWGWLGPRTPADSPVRRYVLQLPEGQEASAWFRRVALSPDGSRLAYLHEGAGGERRLFVLPRDQLSPIELPGTQGAEVPFFSPDGAMIGFVSPRGTVNVVRAIGGAVTPVATTGIGSAGASWAPDGFIYAHGAGGTGLVRVPAQGGKPVRFTTVDSAGDERDHMWPYALPSGRGILFVIKYRENAARTDIAVADVATGAHRVLTAGSYAEYVAGHLVFAPGRSGGLMVQPFDDRRFQLTGEPRVVAQRVDFGSMGAPDFVPDFTTSAGGTLIYMVPSDARDTTDVVWVTRDGVVRPVDPTWTDQLTTNGAFMLSPDGRRLAVTRGGQIWVRQLDNGRMTQLSFAGGIRPQWTPDGGSVAYVSDRVDGQREPFIRRADASEPERPLFFDPNQVHEVIFTADNRWIVYRNGGGGTSDLLAIRRSGDTTRVPLVVTPFQEAQPAVSPDGRWLAYSTLETGRAQVRVRPFPNTNDGNWLVSPNGGTTPVWSHSGRELYYRDGDGNMVSVPVTPGLTFIFGEPRTLFSAARYRYQSFVREYSVSPDDQRFMLHWRRSPIRPDHVVVVENVVGTGAARGVGR
ncbi:MAG: protein kinase [Gemmatimonadota bacterium]